MTKAERATICFRLGELTGRAGKIMCPICKDTVIDLTLIINKLMDLLPVVEEEEQKL